MTLNLLFTKINIKKRNKTIEEYRHEESISEWFEQTKVKHVDMIHRRLY